MRKAKSYTTFYIICKNIRSDKYTVDEKINAINEVICGWPTIMSITKDELREVIRFLLELCVDHPENVKQEDRCRGCKRKGKN